MLSASPLYHNSPPPFHVPSSGHPSLSSQGALYSLPRAPDQICSPGSFWSKRASPRPFWLCCCSAPWCVRKEESALGTVRKSKLPGSCGRLGCLPHFPSHVLTSLSGEASVGVRNTCRKIMTTKLCTGISSRCTSRHQPSSMQPAMEMLQEILMKFSETQHGLRGKSGVREGGSMKGAVRAAD